MSGALLKLLWKCEYLAVIFGRERERRFSLKVTGKGVGGTRVAKCNVNLMMKWSEICSCTRMLSAVQSRL